MLPRSQLKSMKVLFATPCYISAVTMNYVASIFTLTGACYREGLDCILHLHSESLITRGRNMIVAKFLGDPSFTHLFWIDSDIAFSPEAVFRLLLADRDVAAGIYPMKWFNWPQQGLPAGTTRSEFETRYAVYPFNPVGSYDANLASYADIDGFLEVAEAPTGFMAIKRQVFLTMIEKYPELKYMPEGVPEAVENKSQIHLHWLFFDCLVDPVTRRYLSEDFAFCRRWRDIGGKVWADLHSELQHLGQHVFKGNLTASLRARGQL